MFHAFGIEKLGVSIQGYAKHECFQELNIRVGVFGWFGKATFRCFLSDEIELWLNANLSSDGLVVMIYVMCPDSFELEGPLCGAADVPRQCPSSCLNDIDITTASLGETTVFFSTAAQKTPLAFFDVLIIPF